VGGEDVAHRGAVARHVQAQIDVGDLSQMAATDVGDLMEDGDPDASFEGGLDWLFAGAAVALKLT
jgi:hypothetical protein